MKKYFDLFRQTFQEFGEDKAQRLGAALAYYTIFSIAPLLLIAIAIAGVVFGREAAQHQLSAQLSGVLGKSAAEALDGMVAAAAKPKSGTVATLVGIVTLLFGAAGVFGQLKDALNTIWNVEPKKAAGIIGFVRERFLSLAMVLGVGFLLLVTLVFDTAITAMGTYLGTRFPGGTALLQGLQLVISLGLVTLLFAAIFRFLPDTKIEWRDVWLGAAFTAVLFVLGKFGLALYIAKGAVGSAYGAAGSLVIILVWVYWSAQILFFGAEFTQVYARAHGSKAGDPSKEEATAQPARVEDRPKSPAVRAPAAPRTAVPSKGGSAIKLVIGGAVGLVVGILASLVGAVVVAVKSVKKLF
jgi:membrane protein